MTRLGNPSFKRGPQPTKLSDLNWNLVYWSREEHESIASSPRSSVKREVDIARAAPEYPISNCSYNNLIYFYYYYSTTKVEKIT